MDEPDEVDGYADAHAAAQEVADEAVGIFSDMYPEIKMNLTQWLDLKECISREVQGHFGPDAGKMSARDLLPSKDAS